MASPLEAVMIGAGGRGFLYASYAEKHPDELRFVAVAEPNPARREFFAKRFHVAPENCFSTWEDLLARGPLAPAAFNCTQDWMHTASTVALLDQGYHVLLEKPIALSLEDCAILVRKAEKLGRVLQICHVLRFTSFFAKLHEIVDSGRLGDLVSVEHRENVTFWHMAHSYVRGSWANTKTAHSLILAKCCHDLDLMYWNMGPVRKLSSHGSLIHFRPDKAPAGAADRCLDGCPAASSCLYHVERVYLQNPYMKEWPISSETTDPNDTGALRRALEKGPYGRCVYKCDNDVVDQQVVAMQMASGAVGTLIVQGHSYEKSRTVRYDGTRATLRGKYAITGSQIEVHDLVTDKVEIFEPERAQGHGRGDEDLVGAFVRALRSGQNHVLTSARNSLESHLMAFAAEESRLLDKVVLLDAYRAHLDDDAAPMMRPVKGYSEMKRQQLIESWPVAECTDSGTYCG